MFNVELWWDGTPAPDKHAQLLSIFGQTVEKAAAYV